MVKSGLTPFEVQKQHEEIVDQKLQMLNCLDEKSKSILRTSKEKSKILTSKTSKLTHESLRASQATQSNQQPEEDDALTIPHTPCVSNILSPKVTSNSMIKTHN